LNANPPSLCVVEERNLTVETRGFATVRSGFSTSSFDFGGDEVEEVEDVDSIEAVEEPGRGAIGTATSTVLL
jgi:hypothetical protein